MKILKEVTVWEAVNSHLYNHTYMVDDVKGKMVAYKKHHEGDWKYFNKPMNFVKTRRQFEELKNV